jgi:hypothetical protein
MLQVLMRNDCKTKLNQGEGKEVALLDLSASRQVMLAEIQPSPSGRQSYMPGPMAKDFVIEGMCAALCEALWKLHHADASAKSWVAGR